MKFLRRRRKKNKSSIEIKVCIASPDFEGQRFSDAELRECASFFGSELGKKLMFSCRIHMQSELSLMVGSGEADIITHFLRGADDMLGYIFSSTRNNVFTEEPESDMFVLDEDESSN